MSKDITAQLEKLQVEGGDLLLIRFDSHPTQEEVAQGRDVLVRTLNDMGIQDVGILALPPGVDIEVVDAKNVKAVVA